MLTYIMSPVRTLPSIEQQIADDAARRDSLTMSEQRSEANAKEATQSFSKEEQNPLAHQNGDEKTKPGITFAAQEKLPKLPIPDLEPTLKKYLTSLDPLQTAREHQDSERACDEFLRTDGPGLQDKLKQYATGKSSYIEQFCKLSINSCLGELLLIVDRVRFISKLRQPGRTQLEPFLPARG